jgi:cytochrome P450
MNSQADTDKIINDSMLLHPETLKCPYHSDRLLREQAPVHRDSTSGVYIVSTYDLVREVHRTPKVFSNEFGLEAGAAVEVTDPEVLEAMNCHPDLGRGTLLTLDDPQHRMFRDVVKDFFTAENIRSYEPWIRQQARDLVAGLTEKNQCHFVEEFARPLPLSVIMHVLGMPADMFDQAFKWTMDNVTALSQTADQQTLIDAHLGLRDEYQWFQQALAERQGKPARDLLGLIANATVQDRPCTIEEKLSYCTQFLVAGNETTTATLAEGIRQLCLFPEQAALIRADRSLIPNLVEETLRLASPTSNMWRVSKSDYTLGGVEIPASSMVLLKYFSANHDEQIFDEPERFDVTRENLKRHVAFGFGTHVCIGQHLSKLEMTIAWEEIFEHLDELELAVPAQELEYMPNVLLRGLEEITINYSAA